MSITYGIERRETGFEITKPTPETWSLLAHHQKTQKRLWQRLERGPVPLDEWFSMLAEAYYTTTPNLKREFLTPPQLFPDIGACHTNYAASLYEQIGRPQKFDILVVGDGHGDLLRSLLGHLPVYPQLNQAARITAIDLSPTLLKLQKETLGRLADRVKWVNGDITRLQFPEFNGLVILMELDDALPPKGVVKYKDGGFQELFIDLARRRDGRNTDSPLIIERLGPATDSTLDTLIRLCPDWWRLCPTNDNLIPVPVKAALLRQKIATSMRQGAIVSTDYGFHMPRFNFQYPTRPPISAIYRNQRPDLGPAPIAGLYLVAGIADISSSVDFDFLADAGVHSGFQPRSVLLPDWLKHFGLREVSQTAINKMSESQAHIYRKNLTHLLAHNYHVLIQHKGKSP